MVRNFRFAKSGEIGLCVSPRPLQLGHCINQSTHLGGSILNRAVLLFSRVLRQVLT